MASAEAGKLLAIEGKENEAWTMGKREPKVDGIWRRWLDAQLTT